MRRALAFAVLMGAPALAQEAPDYSYMTDLYPATAQPIADAQAYCTEIGGVLAERYFPFTPVDLDGDNGRNADGLWDDVVLDYNALYCTTDYGAWAGSGGALLQFFLDGETLYESFGYVWEVERLGAVLPAVILIAMHGSNCDAAGVSPCVEAVVVDEGEFRTVRPTQ